MIKVAIFDMDDTLISEKEYVKSGYHAVANGMHTQFPSAIVSSAECYERLMRAFHSGSRQVFNEVLDSYHIAYEKQDILSWVNCYRCHTPQITFFPDVLPCLAFLRKQEKSLALLSDGYLETQTRKCDVLGIHDLFDYVILTEELGREYWKPHPRGFEMIKEHFCCGWDEMVYIGDNPQKDFHIRSQFPIHTIEIKRDDQVYLDRPYLDNVHPEYAIHSLEELSTLPLFVR